MKWLAVIMKNLRLLFRSKESAFTIIFGPLLIILLVSAAYTGGEDDGVIRVGTYAPEYTSLADEIITALKDNGYRVSIFNDREECVSPIKVGELHTCIIFPTDFTIKDNQSNEVIFAVDYSRINLVHQITEDLADKLNEQSNIISEDVAGNVLERIALAQKEVSEQREMAISMDERLAIIINSLADGRQEIGSVDINVSFADLKEIRGRVQGLSQLITDMEEESTEALADGAASLRKVEQDCGNCSLGTEESLDLAIKKMENRSILIHGMAEEAPEKVMEVNFVIDDVAEAVEKVRTQFAVLVNASENVDARIVEGLDDLDTISTDLATMRGKLQRVDTSLQQTLGLSAEGVTSPIVTTTEPVNAEEGNLTFTYPYILMLVIMFLGLMINSTLIVMDKTSRAAFRNFTTPTRDEYHVIMSFVTTFLILLAQTLIILLFSYLFVEANIFTNFGVSFVIIVIAITLFSFLGMILGYLAGTHEAAMIASLSLGSILLFISNVVLPLEAMNKAVQVLSSYNPYVVLSELLKQSMVFGELRLIDVPVKISALAGTLFALLLLTIFVQRAFRRKFFQRRSGDIGKANQLIGAKPLQLGDKEIKDLFVLLEVLDRMTRADFEAVITPTTNPIEVWVRDQIGNKRLARKLSTASKEKMILNLEKYLKKHSKKVRK